MTLWGGRFSRAPTDLLREFSQSIDFDRRLYRFDILGSIVHSRMLARRGIIAADDQREIERGLGLIRDEIDAGAFRFDHALEDIHTHVEARLRELIGPAAGVLHTARSRNDQIALDLRMFVRDATLRLADQILGLASALCDRADAWQTVLAPGFTHLQRAQPILLAHHALAYVEMLGRDVARLRDSFARVNVSPLGSGALAGVPYPIDREFVAAQLGFSTVTRNSLDAVGDRDFVAELVFDCALVMAHLSRLGEELILWSTSEFGYLMLDDSLTTGSSIMPQKKNPDGAELVRGKTGRVYGDLVALLTTLKSLPLAYNRDLQEDKEALFDALDTVLPAVEICAAMVRSAQVDEQRLAVAAAAGFSLATDVADYLVRKGMPFREAHAVVGRLVQRCMALGIELADLPLGEYTAQSPLFEPDVLQIDAWASVSARDVPGGTAPARVAAALGEARRQIDESRAWITGTAEELPRP